MTPEGRWALGRPAFLPAGLAAGWPFTSTAAARRPSAGPVGLFARPTAAGLLGRAGSLEVRIAETARDVRRAQRLRYKVFFEEGRAVPTASARLLRRDADAYDSICDHLLVIDRAAPLKPFRTQDPKVVGACRLLRRDRAEAYGGFYSASEFDLSPLLAARPETRFLEVGRSCVLGPYRSKKTVELLWHGIWAYVLRTKADALIGCASLDGTDLRALAPQLSFLHHHAASPPDWRVAPLPGRRASARLLAREELETRAVFKTLPPLVKGYLRMGATFGEGAVVDREFGTTDVFAVLPVGSIQARYIDHFGPAANRYAA